MAAIIPSTHKMSAAKLRSAVVTRPPRIRSLVMGKILLEAGLPRMSVVTVFVAVAKSPSSGAALPSTAAICTEKSA